MVSIVYLCLSIERVEDAMMRRQNVTTKIRDASREAGGNINITKNRLHDNALHIKLNFIKFLAGIVMSSFHPAPNPAV